MLRYLPEPRLRERITQVTNRNEAFHGFADWHVGGRLAANADVRVDEADRMHVTSDNMIAEPPSPVDLRKRVAAMLPRVDIGKQIPEVTGRVPQFLEADCRRLRVHFITVRTGRLVAIQVFAGGRLA